jgi:hypothetical protein
MSSTCSAELADSALDSKEPECERSRFARSSLTAEPSLESTGLPSQSSRTLENSQQQMFPELTLSAAGFPAKILALRERKKELMASGAGCGLKFLGSLAKYDRDTHSWRTSQTLLLETAGDGSAEFSQTWPRSGLMQSGIAYELRPLDTRINEIESGYLPTPQASDGTFRKIRRPVYLIRNAYRILSNQGIDGNAKLADIAWNVWGGKLNPQYVGAMMGFPMNWLKT